MGLGIQTLSPLLLGGDQERAERRGVTWSWARKDFEVVTLLSRGLPGEVLPSRITTMPANNTYFVLCVCCPDEGRSHCGQQIHLSKADPKGGTPGLPNLQGWARASALMKGPGRGRILGTRDFWETLAFSKP